MARPVELMTQEQYEKLSGFSKWWIDHGTLIISCFIIVFFTTMVIVIK